MAPRPWADDHQATFLTAYIERFVDHQKRKKLTDFWPVLETDWFANFPESKVLFGPEAPDVSHQSAEQKAALGVAIAARKRVRL